MQKQKKQLLILLILLVVLALAYAGIRFYNQRQEEKQTEEQEAETIHVTELETGDITGFSYQLDGVTLSFTKNGTDWNYDDDLTVDIEEDQIETMLEKAADITAAEEIVAYDSLAEYGLDEPGNVITLHTEAGITTIYVGNRNEMTGQYYVKTGDSDTVYVVNALNISGINKSVEELTAEQEETETEELEAVIVDETETEE